MRYDGELTPQKKGKSSMNPIITSMLRKLFAA